MLKQGNTICVHTLINKTYTNGFRAATGVIENQGDEIVPPRAQKYNKFLGQQIRIEINQQKVEQDDLNTNHTESQNLLFYDFNAPARQFNFGSGNNMRLSTKDDFRRTGMAGAKNMAEIEQKQPKRRPITSHWRGGDRLPSRASKTRDKSKRIHIGARKKTVKREQQGLTKKAHHAHDSVSPKNNRMYEVIENNRQNVHTAIPKKKKRIFEELNNENEEPTPNRNFRFRERLNKKKDIIIEEEDDNDGEFDKDK